MELVVLDALAKSCRALPPDSWYSEEGDPPFIFVLKVAEPEH
jgi:hypothetical protein